MSTEKGNTAHSNIAKGIAIAVAICLLLYLGLGYLNSYIGYYGYNKHLHRRFSETIEESKERGRFVKEVAFVTIPDTLGIEHVFIERGYRWGSSSRKTRDLETTAFPYQVAVSWPESINGEPVRVVLTNSSHGKSYFEPIADTTLLDTLVFNVLCHSCNQNGLYGKIIVLPNK